MLGQNIKQACKLCISIQAYHNRYLHKDWGLIRITPTLPVSIYLK